MRVRDHPHARVTLCDLGHVGVRLAAAGGGLLGPLINVKHTTLNLLVSCWQMRRSRVGPLVVLPWEPICSVTLEGLLEVLCCEVTLIRAPEERCNDFALVNVHDAAAALPYGFGEGR